ncbi:lysozyme [Gammaproteobacteria bacterium]
MNSNEPVPTSQAGIDLVKEFEGLRLRVYRDAAGLPTVGYGHLIKPGEDFSTGISTKKAELILGGDGGCREKVGQCCSDTGPV